MAETEPRSFLVVGIGGSAGAIASFREFFRHVPVDSGMAYVVILHLSPEHESHLAEVLQAVAKIPVVQVREAVRVEPDRVYVIPPNRSLAMEDGSLILSDIHSYEERRAPIDIFFRTLAIHHDARAVCVVMSGSGTDGSLGLRQVKEYNGLVLVQDPAEAAFGDMPRHSIATGLVDFVVPAAEMPQRILHYRNQLQTLRVAEERPEQAADDEQVLMEIFTLLRLRTGHDFINYKRPTVLRRIERRMVVRDIGSLEDYVALLRRRHDEVHALLNELLISVTNFFRDHDVWDKVETSIIPKLLAPKRSDDQIRVWVPGCATGEEAYTIAMLLAEKTSAPVLIFATDLDEQAILRAREGWYSDTEVADVPPERLRRFFAKDSAGYRVRRELRETVLFAHHNLIKDPPFSHLDFMSCRNLLIYFNRAAQQRALEVMHFALNPGGVLLLGTAEGVDAAPSLFSLVDKEVHVFEARAADRTLVTVPLPYAAAPTDTRSLLANQTEPRLVAENARERFSPIDLHHRLLEEYAAPSLIVDDQHNVVHLSDRAGRYLQLPRGEATSNVLHLVRQELRIHLRSALFEAARKRSNVAARDLNVHTGERMEHIDLVVHPALNDHDPGRGFFLIVFEEARGPRERPNEDGAAVAPAMGHVEEELLRARTQMRAMIEQYEVQTEEAKAANEELQAMNEELRSTAEELETSQEELQSVNEELQTVNQELKVKIDEISHANDDLRNLMTSADIGTIFVDRSFRVKLFTARAREIFNLIPADTGRALSDITSKVALDGLTEEMTRVLERLQTIEREVPGADGSWFLMRLLPYRTSDDRIDGLVLTFLDITERHNAEEALRQSEVRQAFLLELSDAMRPIADPASVLSSALSIVGQHFQADRAVYVETGPDGEWLDVAGVYVREGYPALPDRLPVASFASAMASLRRGATLVIEDVDRLSTLQPSERAHFRAAGVQACVSVPLLKDGRWVSTLRVDYRSPRQWTPEEVHLLEAAAQRTWEATERARAEKALRESEEKYRALFASMDEGYVMAEVIVDANGRAADLLYVEANPPAVRMAGKEMVGRTLGELWPGAESHWLETFARVMGSGIAERHELFASASNAWYSFYVFKVDSPQRRVAAIYSDITARRRTDAALRESEARLQAIADLVPDLLWMTDANGEAVWFNERWRHYTGQRSEEALGWGWMDAIHRDDRAGAAESYRRAIAEGRPVHQEHRICNASGQYRWFLVHAAPELDERGTVLRYYGAATDIDEQRMLREQLEERVHARTRALLELSIDRQNLLERLVSATEEERQRIARELHDEMGQHTTALRIAWNRWSRVMPRSGS